MTLPLIIALRSSRRLIMAQASVHVVLAGMVVWMPMGLPASLDTLLRGALAAAIAACAGLTWYRLAYSPIVALHLARDGRLEVESKLGARETAVVRNDTLVMPALTVLRLRVGARTVSLPLLQDMATADALRQLRLWLRWRTQAV